jgi:hypothetical protein
MSKVMIIPINPRNPNPFFLRKILRRLIITLMHSTPMERKIPIGYTDQNLFRLLSGWKVLIAIALSVLLPMKESPKVRNIPKMIKALLIHEKRISAQIFLFSVLLIEPKNLPRQKIIAIPIPT